MSDKNDAFNEWAKDQIDERNLFDGTFYGCNGVNEVTNWATPYTKHAFDINDWLDTLAFIQSIKETKKG